MSLRSAEWLSNINSHRALVINSRSAHDPTTGLPIDGLSANRKLPRGPVPVSGLPVIRPQAAENLQIGLSMFGLLDYRGWPRRRLHSPRAERMKVKPPSAPSAQSVQTKKKPPVDLAISP